MFAALVLQIAVHLSAYGATSKLPFPDGVKFIVRHKCDVAKYCPDNTCDELEGCGISKDRLKKLFFLYLAEVSDYQIELPEWRLKKATKDHLASTLDQLNTKACGPESSQKARVVCLLRAEQSKKHIKLYFVRFDEGTEARDVYEIK